MPKGGWSMNAPAEALVTLADFDRPDALILGIGNDGDRKSVV